MRLLSASICLQLVVPFSLVMGTVGPSFGADTPQRTKPAVTPAEIEADWLAQIRLRYQLAH